jgi:hypothetical protein
MNSNENSNNINKEKQDIISLIDHYYQNNLYNITKIEESEIKHNEFIKYANKMDLCEVYKWEQIKINYITLKKKITKEKKLNKRGFSNIYKKYSNISSYYSEKEIYNYNNNIKAVYDTRELMLIKFIALQQLHFDTMLQFKKMLLSNNVIKIYEYNERLYPIFVKLYNIYESLLDLDKQFNILKKYKGEIISEIKKATI